VLPRADDEEGQPMISYEEANAMARPVRYSELRRKSAGSALVVATVFALAFVFVRRRGVQTGAGLEVLGGLQRLEETRDLDCAAQGSDCLRSKCCQTGGQTCFEKNQYWATCLDSCLADQPHANDADQEAWTCKALGVRAKFQPGCSWAGDECSSTKQCCQKGYQCMEKNQYWSACTQVEQGPWSADGAPAVRLPKPDGWTGTKLGGWRSEYEVFGGVPAEYAASQTLFCYMAVLPGSPEMALIEEARKRQAGIFGCESSKIFHSEQSDFQEWSTGHATLVNTGVFVKIWEQVKEDGQYLLQDWTVKVDADCVWFPVRLRSHLQSLGAPAYTPIYLKNTLPRYTLGGWLGAIEIFSKSAVETYLDNAAECVEHIGLNSGEDGFLKDCLDALGVGSMHDELIVHPSNAPKECQVKEFVAFHPIKSPTNWTYCYDLADGNVQPPPMRKGAIANFPDAIRSKYTPAALH